jgi:molecular chaperone DnaK
MPPVLGIDFGTTNTAAAWITDDGQLEIVDVSDASRSLPSVVSLLDNGIALVGEQAKEMLGERPGHTFYGLKRLLGRRFASDYIARHQHRFTFDLLEGEYGDVCLSLDGAPMALDDVMVFIVERIVELANACARFTFEECVVSVPAHFTFRQRLKTAQIVERVLKVKGLVNEPTAAALVFALESDADRHVLVYDLGGGTFDVTVLRVSGGDVRVLASGGDAFLGGIDFDRAIADNLVGRFKAEHGIDPTDNAMGAHRIVLAAEQAKIKLSAVERTEAVVPGVVFTEEAFLDLRLPLSRAGVQAQCAPLIERTIGIVEETLRSIGNPTIEDVVLVGGQTADPAVRERLEQVLGVKPRRTKQADLAVAVGAALHASGRCAMSDVTSVPIYVAIPGGPPRELVEAYSRLPCRNILRIEERPPAGADMKLVLYEAVSLSATERDIIGACTVPADWLAQVDGPFELETLLSAGHGVTLIATAPGVKAELLPLVDITSPKKKAIEAEAPAPSTDDAEVFDIDETVGYRTNQAVPFTNARLSRLSTAGATLGVQFAPTIASTIEVQLASDSGPLKLRAIVGMSRPDPVNEGRRLLDIKFASSQREGIDRLRQKLAVHSDQISVGALPSQLDGMPILDDDDAFELIEVDGFDDLPLDEAAPPRPFMAPPAAALPNDEPMAGAPAAADASSVELPDDEPEEAHPDDVETLDVEVPDAVPPAATRAPPAAAKAAPPAAGAGSGSLKAEELFTADMWGDSGPVQPVPGPLNEDSTSFAASPRPLRRRVEGKVEMLRVVSVFIQAVRKDDLYEALAVDPEAPVREIRSQVELLRKVVGNLTRAVGPELADRLVVAQRFLTRIGAILGDEQKRLAYDFKHGHVRAEERLALATGDQEQVALLRRCWLTTFPHRAVEAQKVTAVLQRAMSKGDPELTLDAGEMVMKLDPFNVALRETLARVHIEGLQASEDAPMTSLFD